MVAYSSQGRASVLVVRIMCVGDGIQSRLIEVINVIANIKQGWMCSEKTVLEICSSRSIHCGNFNPPSLLAQTHIPVFV